MITDNIRCAQARAHQYGADWVIARKEAETLLARAAIARARYFRELAALDGLTGVAPSPFAEAV
jgi:hypothetical protein